MAKIAMQAARAAEKRTGAHRVAQSEGEAAIRLLDEKGYPSKRRSNGQSEHRCPFHEEPGDLKRGDAKFYVDFTTSKFYCHSASCGAKGNLTTLERHFGVDPTYADPTFKSRNMQLEEWEKALQANPEQKQVFYDHGLDDATIERFRFGYDAEKERFVIPYLDGKTPIVFRFYNPDPGTYYDKDGQLQSELKYYWERGAQATLYNLNDAGGDDKGRVFVCEGELKAAALVQMGYSAVATPGAGMFKEEWHQFFSDARQIIVLFDNDNPDHPKNKRDIDKCMPCKSKGFPECEGHNAGQDAAAKVTDALGWRAINLVLPLPDDETRKTDVNEYFVRDGHTASEFAEWALGEKSEPYKVQTLAEIMQDPPEQASMLVEGGILPSQGRLLIAGKPKVGKSIFAENLVLSLAAGIPFLGNFEVVEPTRVLLLDRELSRSSLYERLMELMKYRPGYRAAAPNLCVDHDHLVKIDRKGAYDVLEKLVTYNGVKCIVFDTAYKFFSQSMDSVTAMTAAFEVLDKLIHETGVSVILTHHHKKTQNKNGKNEDMADPDNVAGSFLWTGWPNATILLNYLGNSVENPFNAVATFTAFRDAPPPEPLGLYRSRDSVAYSAIRQVSHETVSATLQEKTKPSTEAIMEWLMANTPVPEHNAMEELCRMFGVRDTVVKPYFIDAMASGYFKRRGKPPVIEYHEEGDSWEDDRQLHLIPGGGEEIVNKSLL